MGTKHGRQFHVNMFEEDIQMMKELVKLHPEKETGGNLFGLWNNDEEPVLHVVLGPAIGCTRTEVSFYQSIPYLERVGRLLTERFLLCHIGEWHSHHKLRLSEPSSGDSSTVIRNFPRGARDHSQYSSIWGCRTFALPLQTRTDYLRKRIDQTTWQSM